MFDLDPVSWAVGCHDSTNLFRLLFFCGWAGKGVRQGIEWTSDVLKVVDYFCQIHQLVLLQVRDGWFFSGEAGNQRFVVCLKLKMLALEELTEFLDGQETVPCHTSNTSVERNSALWCKRRLAPRADPRSPYASARLRHGSHLRLCSNGSGWQGRVLKSDEVEEFFFCLVERLLIFPNGTRAYSLSSYPSAAGAVVKKI